MNIVQLSKPLPAAILATDLSVLSRSSGAAVEGFMPMHMSGFCPFVPRMYRYSV